MLDKPNGKSTSHNVYLRICEHLAEETEIRSAARALACEVEHLIPFTHFDICLLAQTGWVASYEVGIETRWSRKRTQIQCSPVRSVLLGDEESLLTVNAMEDPRCIFPGARCEPILKHKLRSRVCVGMKAMGEIIGSLNISHSEQGMYDQSSVAVAHQLANVLAPYFHALHNVEERKQAVHLEAKAHAREEDLRHDALKLMQTLERERQRIGMDLHDQTLAELTRISRDLSGDAKPPSTQELNARIGDCIDDLRRIIDMAVPSLLEFFGFSHALRIHLERAVQPNQIVVDVTDQTNNMPDTLDPDTRIALYRIAQEAINNAARHASASHIKVSIEHNANDQISIVIKDNGQGLSATDENLPSGLSHMRTRARLVGAEFDIFNDNGTCVVVRLPPANEMGRGSKS